MRRKSLRSCAGFTIVELITVMVLIGILGAIGYGRFADTATFSNRAYADQVKSLIRYAQKLAITQNRPVFVRSQPGGFAVCFANTCPNAGLARAPGGSNSGSAGTRTFCRLNNFYIANWMCEGRPNANLVVTADSVRNEFGAAGVFSFDGLGRPYNANDAIGASTFTRMVLTFTQGTNVSSITIEPDTGYVH
ncbi:pilus assembly FimT family protein [Duganella sp. PWIR1]